MNSSSINNVLPSESEYWKNGWNKFLPSPSRRSLAASVNPICKLPFSLGCKDCQHVVLRSAINSAIWWSPSYSKKRSWRGVLGNNNDLVSLAGYKLPRLHNSEFSQELKELHVFPTFEYQEGGIKWMFSVSQEKVIKIQVYFGSGSISSWVFQISLNKIDCSITETLTPKQIRFFATIQVVISSLIQT